MSKIILGLAGEMASGKGTVAEYLKIKYSASNYRFSTILRDVLMRLHLEQSRKNMQKTSTILRKAFGDDLLAKVIAEDVKKDNSEIIVIDGVRRLDDIKYLRKNKEFRLVYIDTGIKKRYGRIINRSENTDDQNKTFEQFVEEHKGEPELQIKGLKKYADIIIDNNGSKEELYKQIDKIIERY